MSSLRRAGISFDAGKAFGVLFFSSPGSWDFIWEEKESLPAIHDAKRVGRRDQAVAREAGGINFVQPALDDLDARSSALLGGGKVAQQGLAPGCTQRGAWGAGGGGDEDESEPGSGALHCCVFGA